MEAALKLGLGVRDYLLLGVVFFLVLCLLFDEGFFSMFTLVLCFFIKFIKVNQSRKNIILASFFLGLAALTKPGAYLLFCPLSVFLLFFLLRIKRIPLAKGFCYIGMFVVIQAAFIGGWTARNYYTEGTWVFCSQVGANAFFYHGAHLKAYQDGIPFREAVKKMREEYETEKVKELDVNERSVYYKGLLTRMILSSPLDYSVVILKYFDFLFLGSPPPDYLFSKQRREELFSIHAESPSSDSSQVSTLRRDQTSNRRFCSPFRCWLTSISSFARSKKS